MVQNLNVLSFAPYGNLLAERSDGAAMPKGAHWEERILSVTAQETYQYCPKESVYLDYQSGMSILAVAKEQEEFQYFYLDKPVRIFPGVRFAIAPYQESCSVRMTAHCNWPKAEPLAVSVRELALSRRLQVERVYTFFYHEKERGFFFRGEEHSMLELTYVDKAASTASPAARIWCWPRGIWPFTAPTSGTCSMLTPTAPPAISPLLLTWRATAWSAS